MGNYITIETQLQDIVGTTDVSKQLVVLLSVLVFFSSTFMKA